MKDDNENLRKTEEEETVKPAASSGILLGDTIISEKLKCSNTNVDHYKMDDIDSECESLNRSTAYSEFDVAQEDHNDNHPMFKTNNEVSMMDKPEAKIATARIEGGTATLSNNTGKDSNAKGKQHEEKEATTDLDMSLSEKFTIAEGGLEDDWEVSLKSRYRSNRDILADLADDAEKGELRNRFKVGSACDDGKDSIALAVAVAVALCKMSHGVLDLSLRKNINERAISDGRSYVSRRSLVEPALRKFKSLKNVLVYTGYSRKNEGILEMIDEENQLGQKSNRIGRNENG